MLDEFSKYDLQKFFSIMLLTDGCIVWHKTRRSFRIVFGSQDTSLHKLFVFLGKNGFNERPNFQGFDKSKNVFVTIFEKKKDSEIIKNLFNLSSTYKTSTMTENKPTISFINESSNKSQLMAFRVAMSCDGCITICKRKNGELVPKLKMCCAHPSLLLEWKDLAENIGLTMFLDRDRNTWSGFHGLCAQNKESILKFKKLGGFFPEDVMVSRGKRKGMKKNTLLSVACNLFEH